MCSSLLRELNCKSTVEKRSLLMAVVPLLFTTYAFMWWFPVESICSTCRCRNVYKDAMVCEAMRAESIVSFLKTRVEELLIEWPNHPALVQVSYFLMIH